ncbi:Crp/Fnr family transcriptional regulator [Poseidonocella sedimentorum]|uniref:cAMP-binding domain of CRP or a regulatory subunit of cAMP-dependent protein kinases n=1 Tax=Poseidonocella sedimentorum TaxID=871652 RepID=A0A1I6CVM7_9RHOB|nr:Crp/Fnr family transcriptional regulator [Poseidonocella sedimentorum]SFQ97256.1 cAMP-binding domain of CRP or a regulatory subunit of cAMP-dependent protein kinases [Poseidonocella sedimentorum]
MSARDLSPAAMEEAPPLQRASADPVRAKAPRARGLEAFYRRGMVRELGGALWRQLAEACAEIRRIEARGTLWGVGDQPAHCALLLDGLIARYIAAPGQDRAARLMVAVHVPGDFVDLDALPLTQLSHDLVGLGPCEIALFPHEALSRIMEQDAGHARRLWRLTMRDAAIQRRWTYRAGGLRALPAMADFICEMDLRLQACGKVHGARVPLPLTQADLAEVSGLSTMHVSRVLRELREAKLCTVQDGAALLHDRAGLRRLAGFDPSYMSLPAEVTPPRL